MDVLVTTDWLTANLYVDDLVILDATVHMPDAGRNPHSEFLEQHIIGARFLDLASLKDETSAVPAALPRAEQFSACLSKLGIKPSDHVVLYDNSMLRSSARAYFLFKMFGFENLSILDGGFAKWTGENRPVEAGSAEVKLSTYAIVSDDRSRVRSKADMLANCKTRHEQVVDARDAGRFNAEVEDAVHGLEGGHIPGARNLHFVQLFKDDGTFEDEAELHSLFVNAGIDLDQPVTGSCGSGMTASVVLFAMELLGREGALYDGSWSEWGADPATPKEQGSAP